MAEFRIRIAGKTAAVTSIFDSTKDYCRAYLTEEEPDFSVSVSREDLAFEQEALRQEAIAEGIKIRVFTDPFLDRAAIQRKVAEHLLPHGVLLFHGSAVALDGEGYLFTADCGTGKSTHTRLWRQVFGSRAVMINDDKPFLKLTDSGVLVCGAPWSGKHGLDSNITVPLKGLCILRRGPEDRIRPISPEEALPMLFRQCGLPDSPGQHALVEQLAQAVPLWEMECTKTENAPRVAREAMAGSPDPQLPILLRSDPLLTLRDGKPVPYIP